MIYLDTSAFLKLYILGPGRAGARQGQTTKIENRVTFICGWGELGVCLSPSTPLPSTGTYRVSHNLGIHELVMAQSCIDEIRPFSSAVR